MSSYRLTIFMAIGDAIVFLLIWFGLYALRDWLADAGIHDVPINPIKSYLVAPLVYLPFWFAVAPMVSTKRATRGGISAPHSTVT